MDELDHQAKQFKTNAEMCEMVCDKISYLSQDKRKARKTYQEEHTKISARLNHVSYSTFRLVCSMTLIPIHLNIYYLLYS